APAPAPVPTPSQVFPPPQQPPTSGGAQDGPNGFPENTPLAEMTDRQQANYHKHHSRRWQARAEERSDYDDLKAKAARLAELEAQSMTDTQKAVADAEQRGRVAALAEAGGRLATSALHTSLTLTQRLTAEQIDALLAPLDPKAFLTADGMAVDTGKVAAYVNVVAAQPASPAAPPAAPAVVTPPALQPVTGQGQVVPDMGQGTRTAPKAGGLEAGRLMAQQMFGKRTA
ncbi:hypothetical protein ABT336_13365, partial [Micromonospora sp. NPDC000207]|uniref:hypothetical protein n=1 Tax=Micromonospora sp. NPDC000207 TaxID=3154246 RepID=UPI003320DE32